MTPAAGNLVAGGAQSARLVEIGLILAKTSVAFGGEPPIAGLAIFAAVAAVVSTAGKIDPHSSFRLRMCGRLRICKAPLNSHL